MMKVYEHVDYEAGADVPKRDYREDFKKLRIKLFVKEELSYRKDELEFYRGHILFDSYAKESAKKYVDFLIEMKEYGYHEEEIIEELHWLYGVKLTKDKE